MNLRLLRWSLPMAAAFAFVTTSIAAIDDGLVLYYPFEGDGDALVDSSGNGFDGLLGSCIRSEDGLVGKALQFASRTDSASVSEDPALAATDGFTVSFWLMPTDLDFSGENRVCYKHDQFNIDLLRGEGRIEARSEGAWFGSSTAEQAVALGEWVHVVGTFSAETGTARFHNGQYVTGNSEVTSIDPNVAWWRLGDFGIGGYAGLMDEFRYYLRGMNEAEIMELYNAPMGGSTAVSPESSLASTWGGMKAGQ